MGKSKHVTVRIFGSDNCQKCEALRLALYGAGVFHEFVDAMADETQDLCDANFVNHLPHVQLLSDKHYVLEDFGADPDVGHVIERVSAIETGR